MRFEDLDVVVIQQIAGGVVESCDGQLEIDLRLDEA